MSVVMVVAPILSASWPILTTAACSAAASFGYSIVKNEKELKDKPVMESVEMDIENSEVFKEQLKDRKELVFKKEDVTVTFFATDRGKCSLKVCGEGKSKEEMRKIGAELMHKVTQQYVYNKVVSELKHQGYAVASEEIKENKTVRVIVRRFA